MKNSGLIKFIPLFNLKPKNVMIIGNYGDGNIGDEAMLKVIVNDLLSLGIKNISVPSRTPQKLKEIHPSIIKAISIKSFIKELFFTDLVIIGSGSLFAINSSFFIYLISFIPLIAKILNKKIMYYAIGFSSFTNKKVKLVSKISFSFSDIISVRDKISLDNIKKLGIKKKIYIVEDPAFRLKSDYKTADTILLKEKINKNKFLMGISLNNTVNKKLNIKIIEEFTKIIDWLIENFNAEIVFFTFDPAFSHDNPDNKIALDIKSKLKNNSEFKIISYYSSPEAILGLIGKMNFFIGMRYHSIMFSHMQKIPFLGIIYEEKNETLLKEIRGRGVNLQDIKFEKITSILESMIKN